MLKQNLGANRKIFVDLNAGKILNFNGVQSNKSPPNNYFRRIHNQLKHKRKNNIVKCEQIQCQSNPKTNYLKSEAGPFLFSQGAQTEALDDIQFNSPEIFELSAYHIGTSILRYKEAGLSENIFSADLLREFVGVDAECAFRIFTRIFLFGRKFERTESWKFLDTQIDNTKLVLLVLKKRFTKPQIFEVVSSNPDILCADSKQLKYQMEKMYFSLQNQIDERELSEKFLQLLVITDFY